MSKEEERGRAPPPWLRLLSPISWLTVFSSAKDFSGHAVLGNRTFNTWGLHTWRVALANSVCRFRRSRMRGGLPPALTQQWDRDGYVRIDNFLGSEWLAAVRKELLQTAFPMIEMAQPPALTRRANLDAETCQQHCPALFRLISNRTLLSLLQYAAGYRGRPTVAVQCIHSGQDDPRSSHDPQTDWHVDTFHSTAKAWLFLHEVAADQGPLAYAPGSHRRTPSRLAWDKAQSVGAASHANPLHAKGSFRASPADLAAMGYVENTVGVVPADTLVVADTSGFHRRTPSPRATVRVEIYFSLRRNPFFAGLYPSLLGLPWLRDHWAGLLFRVLVWLHRRGTPSWIPMDERGLNAAEKRALGG